MKLQLILLIVINIQICFGQNLDKNIKPISRNNVYFFENETGPYTLNLEISDLKSNEGLIALEVLDVNKNRIAATSEIKIVDFKSIVRIDSLKGGKYVVHYFHDENKNGKLDLGFFGIPKESYGNSKNVLGFMGPPKYRDLIINIVKDISIKMAPVN